MKTYPPVLNEIAEVMGRRRNENNRQMNIETNNLRDFTEGLNVGGALCELIVLNAMVNSGQRFVAHKIFDDGFVKGPDFTIDGQTYDVKEVTTDELRVNAKAHSEKKAEMYAFVKVDRERCTYQRWVVPWEDVEQWDVRDMSHPYTPFRYRKL